MAAVLVSDAALEWAALVASDASHAGSFWVGVVLDREVRNAVSTAVASSAAQAGPNGLEFGWWDDVVEAWKEGWAKAERQVEEAHRGESRLEIVGNLVALALPQDTSRDERPPVGFPPGTPSPALVKRAVVLAKKVLGALFGF